MNPILLAPDGCRAAILDYRRRLRSLMALVRHAGRLDDLHPAHAALAELRGEFEGDVHSRSTLEAQAGMSGVEARVFEPALRQARIALAFPARAHGDAWLTRLQAADACLLVAPSQLNGPPAGSAPKFRRAAQRPRP